MVRRSYYCSFSVPHNLPQSRFLFTVSLLESQETVPLPPLNYTLPGTIPYQVLPGVTFPCNHFLHCFNSPNRWVCRLSTRGSDVLLTSFRVPWCTDHTSFLSFRRVHRPRLSGSVFVCVPKPLPPPRPTTSRRSRWHFSVRKWDSPWLSVTPKTRPSVSVLDWKKIIGSGPMIGLRSCQFPAPVFVSPVNLL